LIIVGVRPILGGIAALIMGFAFGLGLQSEGRQDVGSTDAEPRTEPSRMSVFGTIHPRRFDAAWDSLGLQISERPRLRTASLGPALAFAPADEDTGRRSEPAPMRRGTSFDERFLLGEGFGFDQRSAFEDRFVFEQSSVFEERFAFDQRPESFEARFALAAAATSEAEERKNSVTSSVASIVRLPAPGSRDPAAGRSGFTLASATSAPAAAPAKKVRLAALEMPKGSSLSPDTDSKTAIYDITARTVYMPDGRRLEAHSGLGDRMDDPRHIKVRREGPTPPGTYNLSMRESLFHGVRAIRLTPVDESKMFGRDGILAHTYMLGPSGQSNGCVSFSDYPAFLQAFQRGEVTRIVVVERLTSPPPGSTQVAGGWFLKSLKDLFSGPDRTASSQPERATGYAAAN
jgi:hypothetical protein